MNTLIVNISIIMKNSFYYIFLIFLTFVFTISVSADSWELPKTRTVCSENNEFCLKVIPKKLESQLSYFEDKVDGKKNAGADKKVKENYCKGIFYVRDRNGNLREQWKIKLANEVSPVDVLVSNKGGYIVTFDNWHSVGYGDDAVVIYETSKGEMINKLGLSDFLTENDIYELPRSTSSVWWGGKHFISKEKQNLVLQITKGKRSYEKDAEYFPINVDLKTGKVLDEIKDRLPYLQFSIKPIETGLEEIFKDVNVDNICDNSKSYRTISSTDFLKMTVSQEELEYPPAARAANLQGIVVLKILINENGDVDCVIPISGQPLLKNFITKAIKNWKFEKSEGKYKGKITFEVKGTLISP